MSDDTHTNRMTVYDRFDIMEDSTPHERWVRQSDADSRITDLRRQLAEAKAEKKSDDTMFAVVQQRADAAERQLADQRESHWHHLQREYARITKLRASRREEKQRAGQIAAELERLRDAAQAFHDWGRFDHIDPQYPHNERALSELAAARSVLVKSQEQPDGKSHPTVEPRGNQQNSEGQESQA